MNAMGPGFDAEYYLMPKMLRFMKNDMSSISELGNFWNNKLNKSLVTDKSELALQTS